MGSSAPPRARGPFVVGIDLGTSNTVVAWAPRHGRDEPKILPLPQLVTATEVEARPLLPSLLYAPVAGEAPVDPWGDAPWVTGDLARRRGGEVPGRLVASAKSWLCHPGVDRTAAILPWGAAEDAVDLPRVSPVEAAARVLGHVRASWDAAHPQHPLAEQEVVLTVPASFDEVARELTVSAAESAGLSVRLLEEPQAAFYDHMHRAGPAGIEALLARAEGDGAALVLVCDVGGGTTDLSLIRVSRADGGEPSIERVAVGHHLLLGGDNMDLALAHACEARLVAPPGRLDAARFAQLTLACRAAKERLLGDDPPEDLPIALAAAGSRLVGGTLATRLDRAETERVVLDGFLPDAPRDAKPQRSKTALVAFGLPYEKDAAITRHVAWFFARHAPSVTGPHALLLNGGVFNAPRIARRLAEVIQSWGGPPLEVLPHADADLAVARGAVVYGLALAGRGRRIEGGAARGYYVGVEPASRERARSAICVVPRGAKEGTRHVASGRPLALVVGRPVRFDLFASDDDRIDAPGDLVTVDDEAFQALPPVAVSFGASDARTRSTAPPAAPGRSRPPGAPMSRGLEIPVVLEGELTAVGTLDLACVEIASAQSTEAAPRRFRLAFQLREAADGARSPSQAPASRSRVRLEEAREAVLRVYGRGRPEVDARDAKQLMRELERILGDRGSWTIETARTLFDALVDNVRSRKRTPDHERQFWWLAGFSLRPGFGDALDAERVKIVEPLFVERLAFATEVRGWQQYWIAWRRMAGGLAERTQLEIRDYTDPFLAPSERKLKKPKGAAPKPESMADLLELVSSLERVPAARRGELGGWIVERTWTDRDPRLWAALGRLGARIPAYASVHHVVSPAVAERWLDHLLREKWTEIATAAPAAVQMARVTGDRARDVSDRTRAEVERKLTAMAAHPDWIRVVRELVPVAEAERATWFGDSLPVGLRLVGV